MATTGFPSAVSEVRVVQNGSVVASSQVAIDGSFVLEVPAGHGFAFQAVDGAGTSRVVFPRSSGSVDRGFSVRAAGPAFDFGTIRFIGSSTATTFSFKTDATEASDCDDGHDSTGATCVDDQDDSSGTCGGDDGAGEDNDTGTDDNDQGDAVADHNFPSDGCTEDDDGSDDHGSDSGSDG